MGRNKKTIEQRIQETDNVAKAIIAFLDEKRIFKSTSRTQLKIEFNKICRERKISIYANPLVDYLYEKGAIIFKSNTCEIKPFYNKDEIKTAILEFKDRNNANKKPSAEYNKTRIKRRINRTSQTDQKLIPLTNALSKMTIKQRIEGIPVKELIDFLRNEWGYEITCRKEVTIIQEF